MKVFFYSAKLTGDEKRLHQQVTASVPDDRTEIFDSPQKLSKAFQIPGNKPDIVILLIEDLTELQEFVYMRKKLLTSRIILVLPDRDRETVAMGHRLLPRFISYRDNDFSDVGAVLAKISRTSVHQGVSN